MDMAPQIMPGFDPEMADYAVRHLAKKGIRVLTSTKLEGITGTLKAEGVQMCIRDRKIHRAGDEGGVPRNQQEAFGEN